MGLPEYYNLRYDQAKSGLDRWGFLRTWWRLYAQERQWAAPYYPAIKEALDAGRNFHLKRLAPRLVCLRGVTRKQPQPARNGEVLANLGWGITAEASLCCALLTYDRRRSDGSAYLALLHSHNTLSGLEGLLEFAAKELAPLGARRILGPVGISPYLYSGVLANLWNQTPPIYAAYNPPFLPELMAQVMEPASTQQMYQMAVATTPGAEITSQATLEPLDAQRLTGDLLALLEAACQTLDGFPPPDVLEAGYLLSQIRRWPNWGWLAKVDGHPAGFILLQPEVSALLQRTRGGRTLRQRLTLMLLRGQPVHDGRVIFGGVAPAYRGQGVARQLWQQAMRFARSQGWDSLSVGPLSEDGPGARFCASLGGQPKQQYLMFAADL
jgi:ribosomal protein S18 acetylase RimI-like enzyme